MWSEEGIFWLNLFDVRALFIHESGIYGVRLYVLTIARPRAWICSLVTQEIAAGDKPSSIMLQMCTKQC